MSEKKAKEKRAEKSKQEQPVSPQNQIQFLTQRLTMALTQAGSLGLDLNMAQAQIETLRQQMTALENENNQLKAKFEKKATK